MGLGESLALVEKLRQAWRGAGNPAVRSTELTPNFRTV